MLKSRMKLITIIITLFLIFSMTPVFANNQIVNTEALPTITSTEDATKTDEIETSEEKYLNTQLQENNYKKSDVYLTGDNITIDYIVDGNLFICANTVTINSQIGGDAFIIAKNIVVDTDAYIFSNLFAISNSIEIKGVIYDVYSSSQNLTISGGYIYRDVKAYCKTLNVNGTIGRNAFINCLAINFNTEPNTNGIIYGDLNYTAKSELSIPENAVDGEVKYTQLSNLSESSVKSIIKNYILDLGQFLAFILIIGLICLCISPKFLEESKNYAGKKLLGLFGYGLLGLILIPITCIILFLLNLTINVSLLLLAIYILAIVVSKSIFIIVINNYICSKLHINKKAGVLGMLIGTGIIIWALTNIPYVNIIISAITIIFGLGILINSILPKNSK